MKGFHTSGTSFKPGVSLSNKLLEVLSYVVNNVVLLNAMYSNIDRINIIHTVKFVCAILSTRFCGRNVKSLAYLKIIMNMLTPPQIVSHYNF